MKFDIDELRRKGFTSQEINLLLDQNCQRKVTGSNVTLTPEEIALHRARFQAKTYSNRDEVPMRPRQAAALERKYGLNKNLTGKQVDELINRPSRKSEEVEE